MYIHDSTKTDGLHDLILYFARTLFCFLLGGALLASVSVAATDAHGERRGASRKHFSFSDAAADRQPGARSQRTRRRGHHPLSVNTELANTRLGDLIDFSEPNGASYAFEVKRVKKTRRGNTYVSAEETGTGRTMRFALSPAGKIRGMVNLGSDRYHLEDSLDTPVLISSKEAELEVLAYGEDIVLPALPRSEDTPLGDVVPQGAPPQGAAPVGGSIISLLVLYEPSLSSPSTTIDYIVGVTNDIYGNSGTGVTVEVVAQQSLAYGPTDDSTALGYITNDATVEQWRDLYRADMVTFIRPFDRSDGNCGIAWIIGANGNSMSTSSARNSAFSVANVGSDGGSFCSDESLAHELGHNFGAAHNRAAGGSIVPHYNYAYGDGISGSFGTVMATFNPETGYFSSPLISDCNGNVCGQANYTDVARAIDNVRDLYADVYPSAVPAAPSINSVSGGTRAITVYFSSNGDGGSPITSFQASCGSFTQSGSGSPITVGGLSDNTTYSCSVVAINAEGASLPSTSVNATTDAGAGAVVPEAPSITSVEAGYRAILVRFAPNGDGGSPITSYQASCGSFTQSGSGSPITVGGLSDNTTYSCSVVAINAEGASLPSTSVNATTDAGAGAVVPEAPSITSVEAGYRAILVRFAPNGDGGSPITSYQASCGSFTQSGSGSPITVGGLSDNTTYSCSVVAINAEGASLPSTSLNVTTDAGAGAVVPDAPTITSVEPENGAILVRFSPNDDGGSAITSFTATCGGESATGTSSPITVTGLVNGATYQCSVTASNAVGVSASSSALSAVPAKGLQVGLGLPLIKAAIDRRNSQ